MAEPNDVALRLAAIVDELAALPAGASSERYRLLRERDALRAEASAFKQSNDDGRTTESLRAELDALRKQRAALVDSMSGYVIGEGGHSLGHVDSSVTSLRGRSRAVATIDRVTMRMSEIADELAKRHSSTPID